MLSALATARRILSRMPRMDRTNVCRQKGGASSALSCGSSLSSWSSSRSVISRAGGAAKRRTVTGSGGHFGGPRRSTVPGPSTTVTTPGRTKVRQADEGGRGRHGQRRRRLPLSECSPAAGTRLAPPDRGMGREAFESEQVAGDPYVIAQGIRGAANRHLKALFYFVKPS
jgi:hypothetical protein